jgi:hypothetical protein
VAAAGLARLFLDHATFLENYACVEQQSRCLTGAGVGPPLIEVLWLEKRINRYMGLTAKYACNSYPIADQTLALATSPHL